MGIYGVLWKRKDWCDMKFKKGDTFYVRRWILTTRRTKVHVIEIVEDMVVYKWYSFRKNSWLYDIDNPWRLELKLEDV